MGSAAVGVGVLTTVGVGAAVVGDSFPAKYWNSCDDVTVNDPYVAVTAPVPAPAPVVHFWFRNECNNCRGLSFEERHTPWSAIAYFKNVVREVAGAPQFAGDASDVHDGRSGHEKVLAEDGQVGAAGQRSAGRQDLRDGGRR